MFVFFGKHRRDLVFLRIWESILSLVEILRDKNGTTFELDRKNPFHFFLLSRWLVDLLYVIATSNNLIT